MQTVPPALSVTLLVSFPRIPCLPEPLPDPFQTPKASCFCPPFPFLSLLFSTFRLLDCQALGGQAARTNPFGFGHSISGQVVENIA